MRYPRFWLAGVLIAAAGLAAAHTHTWTAGSDYQGKVHTGIAGGVAVVWYCADGECVLNGPWGRQLNLQSCQNLVRQVGKIRYYRNDAGKEWSARRQAQMLARCNSVAPH